MQNKELLFMDMTLKIPINVDVPKLKIYCATNLILTVSAIQ